MKHTPGPWSLQDQRVLGRGGGTVALLTNPLHGAGEIMDWPRHGGETENATAAHLSAEANARLIAAAPALLEALETVAESFGRKLDATLTTDEVEALVKVHAAIEAAK